ncbi:MAG: hypothetical protein Q9167_003460 [Letrouitia subvulpina]
MPPTSSPSAPACCALDPALHPGVDGSDDVDGGGGADEELAVRAGDKGSGGESVFGDGTTADGMDVGGGAVGAGAVEGGLEARRRMDWAAVWSYGRGLCGDGWRDDILIGLFGSKDKLPKPAIIPPDQPHSLASQLLIGCGFAIALVVIITGARLATRIWRKEQVFGLDDWVIIPAALLSLTYFINIIVRTHYGCAGRHINDCTYREIAIWAQVSPVLLLVPAFIDSYSLQLGGINQITFFAAVTLVKISMCLFNQRLTSLTSKPWQIVNNAFLGILIVWFFISFFVNVFQCQPVTGFFNYSIQVHTPKYHCMDKAKISNSFSIINCVIFVSEVSWTIADIFFSTIVASLPALNAFVENGLSRMCSSLGFSSKQTGKSSSSGRSRSRYRVDHVEESGNQGTKRSKSRDKERVVSNWIRLESMGPDGDQTPKDHP